MKKLRTKVVVSCVIISNSKIPLDQFIEKDSPINFGDLWGHLSMRNIYAIQDQSIGSDVLSLDKKLPIKVINSFVIQAGKLLGKKTCQVVLHMEMSRATFIKIKGKGVTPVLVVQPMPNNKGHYVDLVRLEIRKHHPDPLTSHPVILGEKLDDLC